MRYIASDEKRLRLRAIQEEIRAIQAEINKERVDFFAQLVADGWQRYVAEVTYSSAYDPWGVGGFRRDGDVREDVYYFAPHVRIPEFGEFIQTYSNDGDADFVEFLDTLRDEDWYEL